MNREPLDRLVLALSLYQRGEGFDEIGRRLPNRRGNGDSVGPTTAVQAVRQGVRVVATAVLLGERPPGLPDHLWPPEKVRAAMQDARGPRRREAAASAYRLWLCSHHRRPGGALGLGLAGPASLWQLVAWLALALLAAVLSGRRRATARRG